MLNTKARSTDKVLAQITQGGEAQSAAQAGGVYTVECYDKDGQLKWSEAMHNLVVNVGLKDMNDKYFTGSTYTAAWYLGLVTGPGAGNTYAAANTMASHAGWAEDVGYSQSTRPAATFAAATTADPSVITNSASVAVFSISATTTIAGAFLTSDNTKSGTTGVLFSVANFASPGDRAVVSGDS
jgi:hypothetical protein